jgi:hypothetical protein
VRRPSNSHGSITFIVGRSRARSYLILNSFFKRTVEVELGVRPNTPRSRVPIASSKAAFEAAAQLHDDRWRITHPDETSGLAGDNGSDSGKLEVHFSGLPAGVKATVKHTPTNGQSRRVTAMATAGGTAMTGGF